VGQVLSSSSVGQVSVIIQQCGARVIIQQSAASVIIEQCGASVIIQQCGPSVIKQLYRASKCSHTAV